MTDILFLCHGNICRSPMAEYIMKELVRNAGLEDQFRITSAACSSEEEGNDLYPPTRKALSQHGIPFGRHRAHKVREDEMRSADHIIVMDRWNLRNLGYTYGNKYTEKTKMLLSYCGEDEEISDPWWTRDFETAYWEIYGGCEAMLASLTDK